MLYALNFFGESHIRALFAFWKNSNHVIKENVINYTEPITTIKLSQ